MNRVLEIVLALTICGVTLAFGGVQTITFTIMEFVVFTLLLLLVVKQTREGQIDLPLPVWPLLFVLLVALQLLPMPTVLLGKLSPGRLSDLAATSHAGWAALTIYANDTWLDLIKFLAYLSAFMLAAHVSDLRKSRSFLIRVLILLGVVEAGYGIVQYLTGWQKIFTYTKKYDLEEATGTFINRNHFAGFLEMVIPFVLASAFYSFQTWASRRHAFHGTLEEEERASAGHQTIFYLFLLIFMVVAVVFSRSRMGILVTLFTIVVLTLLAQLKVRRKAWLGGVLAFLACAVGYGLWIGLGPVLTRFEKITDPTYLSLEGRMTIWADTLRLVRDFPLLGTGLGTFDVVYRQYQTGLVNLRVDHAHNDFLEFAADTGLVGAVLLFLPMIYLLGKMIAAFLEDRRSYRRSITLGCIGSTLALLVHSLADFNLHIPANTLIFAVILGIGYRIAVLDRRATGRAGPPNPVR
jgi:O-antigen ligase